MPGSNLNTNYDDIVKYLESKGFSSPSNHVGFTRSCQSFSLSAIPKEDDPEGEFYLKISLGEKHYFQKSEEEKMLEWMKLTNELF